MLIVISALKKIINFLKENWIRLGFDTLVVVLGILSAYSLNNWNEDRKNANEIEKLISAFENDLLLNIERASGVIDSNYKKDSLYNLVMFDEVTRDMYNNRELLGLTFNFKYAPTIDHNLATILKKDDLGKKYNSLLEKIKYYSAALKSEKKAELDLMKFANDGEDFLYKNFTWAKFANQEDIDSAKDYFLNDPFYANRISQSMTKNIHVYNVRVNIRRNYELGLIYSIKEIKSPQKTEYYRMKFEGLGMEPFNKIDCNQKDLPPVRPELERLTTSFLIVNQSQNTVSIFRFGRDGKRRYKLAELEPSDFIDTYEFRGYAYPGFLYELGKGEQCIQLFQSLKNGYLIIE